MNTAASGSPYRKSISFDSTFASSTSSAVESLSSRWVPSRIERSFTCTNARPLPGVRISISITRYGRPSYSTFMPRRISFDCNSALRESVRHEAHAAAVRGLAERHGEQVEAVHAAGIDGELGPAARGAPARRHEQGVVEQRIER